MSDQPPAPGRRVDPVLTVLLLLGGIILLLPGLCSLVAIAIIVGDGLGDIPGSVFLLWIFCFALTAWGISLIRYAVRKDGV